MTNSPIRQHIIDRVIARRGRLRWFDALDARSTALIVIDMQETFCAPGAPAEVPASRDIVPAINNLARGLRALGGQVIYVLHANTRAGSRSDWDMFFEHVVAAEVRARTIESLAPGRQQVWRGLEQDPDDLVVFKNRYSALISGSSNSRAHPAQHEDRHAADRGHEDERVLRVDRARRHDARFPNDHGLGLLRRAVA